MARSLHKAILKNKHPFKGLYLVATRGIPDKEFGRNFGQNQRIFPYKKIIKADIFG